MLDTLYDALAHYVVLEVPDTGFFLGLTFAVHLERVRAMDTKMRLPKQAMELWLSRGLPVSTRSYHISSS